MSKTIGALWKRQSKGGLSYLSGILEDISGDVQIAVFVNDKKEKESQPDFRIVRSDPKKGGGNGSVGVDPFGGMGGAGMGEPIDPSSLGTEIVDEIQIENIPF